jgi:hypothetical protein
MYYLPAQNWSLFLYMSQIFTIFVGSFDRACAVTLKPFDFAQMVPSTPQKVGA